MRWTEIFSLFLILFFPKWILCKGSRKSGNHKGLHGDSDKLAASNGEERTYRGILKTSEKRETSNVRKRVRFSDQVLDDKIGTEPLDSKVEAKNPKKRIRKSSSANQSSFYNVTVPFSIKSLTLLSLFYLLFIYIKVDY